MDLIHHDDGPSPALCKHCSAEAVGPCARCEAPVCGDCCVLTEGGAKVYAICIGCEGRSGRSLSRGWATVLGWVLGPIALLFLLVVVLALLTGR